MQLKSFVRLKELAPGETAEAELVVNREELRYYDVISEAMLLESGDYTFMAGASSGDIRQQAVVRLEGECAGKRSPWELTAADRYDDYENALSIKGQTDIPASSRERREINRMRYCGKKMERSRKKERAYLSTGISVLTGRRKKQHLSCTRWRMEKLS